MCRTGVSPRILYVALANLRRRDSSNNSSNDLPKNSSLMGTTQMMSKLTHQARFHKDLIGEGNGGEGGGGFRDVGEDDDRLGVDIRNANSRVLPPLSMPDFGHNVAVAGENHDQGVGAAGPGLRAVGGGVISPQGTQKEQPFTWTYFWQASKRERGWHGNEFDKQGRVRAYACVLPVETLHHPFRAHPISRVTQLCASNTFRSKLLSQTKIFQAFQPLARVDNKRMREGRLLQPVGV